MMGIDMFYRLKKFDSILSALSKNGLVQLIFVILASWSTEFD